MSNVLVTGAAGFLGSAVCRAAVSRGDRVTGLVRPGELVRSVPGAVYRDIDWNDSDDVMAALSKANPHHIIHCAGATPHIGEEIEAAYDANVRLVWQLMVAVGAAEILPRVVLVSSSAVYGPSAPVPATEDAPLAPVLQFGWTKLIAEETARAFAFAESELVCIARPFNMFGVGEPAGTLVSDVVAQLIDNPDLQSVRVRETGSVRDFIDVDDAAGALLLLAERGEPGEAYNVCSGEGTSVADVVAAILSVWGSRAEVEVEDPDAVATTSTGSCEKLEALGWTRANGLVDTLARLREAHAAMDTA